MEDKETLGLVMLRLCMFCVRIKPKNPVRMSEPWGYGKDNGRVKIFGRKNFEKIEFGVYLFGF